MARLRIVLHGKAAGDPRVREAVSALRREGHAIGVNVTWEAGDAERFAKDAAAQAHAGELDVLVAGGGDGTISEVFGAALSSGAPPGLSVALLPLGTANDFARSAGVPTHDLTAALSIAATTAPTPIDVGAVNGRIFVNIVSGGFGSRITAETDPRLKAQLGGLAYAVTGLARFAELRPARGRFMSQGFVWEGAFLACAIGNGRQAGGGVPLCPNALLDDGLLELTILPEMSRDARVETIARLLREGAAAIRSETPATRSAWIEYESGEDLNINLDGEPMVARRFRIECRPRAIRLHTGPGALLISRAPQIQP